MSGEIQYYPDETRSEKAQFRVDGVDPITREQKYKPNPEQPEFDLKVPEQSEFDAETTEIFEEIRKGDFTNADKLKQLTPEIARMLAESNGKDFGFLDMITDPTDREEAKAIILGNAVMMQEEASEYNTRRILDLDGISQITDPTIAAELVKFKGALKMDGLQGGDVESMKILFSHKGPLIVRNLSAVGLDRGNDNLISESLVALAERKYFTPVRNELIREDIRAYSELKRNPEKLTQLVKQWKETLK